LVDPNKDTAASSLTAVIHLNIRGAYKPIILRIWKEIKDGGGIVEFATLVTFQN
jgi:hypothetical protein